VKTFLIKLDEEQKAFIEQALFEKQKHNPMAEPLLGMFKEAFPSDSDVINDFTA